MDTSKFCAPSFLRRRLALQRAFSLVEVTLALGIVSFAFVSVFGLIPMGLTTFRQAMDASVGFQITQRVLSELHQTDFNNLTSNHTGNYLSQPVRYFDDQGNEMTAAGEATYHVHTRIAVTTDIPTSPASGQSKITNTNLATVTVQITNNPGNRDIRSDPQTLLWNDPRFPISTFSGLVSQNQ